MSRPFASVDSAAPLVDPPDPHTRAPRAAMPAKACDSHAHVCGPLTRYPCIAERIYTPRDTGIGDYRRMLEVLGVERAVLVQPSFYGADNRALLDALATAPDTLRGVAVLADETSDAELDRLHAAGVRGVRMNIVDLRDGTGQLPLAHLRHWAARIARLGWHIELLMHVDVHPALDRELADLPCDLVFGHLGYVHTGRGAGTPGFLSLLRLLREGRAWVKLTAPYRLTDAGWPYADVDDFAQALLDTAPQRLVWGSDWPHVKVKWTIPMPNDADFADLLLRWVPDPAQREQILVHNPAMLYDFG